MLFAREGARVAVADMSASGAAETVGMINAGGGQAISITVDVTKSDQVVAMFKATLAAFGRLDCAFNNAGIAAYQVGAAGKKTADWSEESFDRMIDVNLKGVWLCMRGEFEQMQKQGGGAIVNTASIAGLVGMPTSSIYVASKHGVIGLTKTAAIEYAETKIRVNSVCPGYIETDMTKDTSRYRPIYCRCLLSGSRTQQIQALFTPSCPAQAGHPRPDYGNKSRGWPDQAWPGRNEVALEPSAKSWMPGLCQA